MKNHARQRAPQCRLFVAPLSIYEQNSVEKLIHLKVGSSKGDFSNLPILATNADAIILAADHVSDASNLEAKRACKLLQSHECQLNVLNWPHSLRHSLK